MASTTKAGDVRLVTDEAEKKYGLPEGALFKMASIESNFNKDAVSPKGANGYFQFMPATAKEYGLTDPSDLPSSADAAGRKMRDLMKKHSGNLDYALVDYNGGGNAVKALVAGNPWKESAGYLEKFHGSTQASIAQGRPKANTREPLQMGEQFTSQRVSPLSQPTDAAALDRENRQQDNEYGGFINGASNIPRATVLGFQTQNMAWNYYQDLGISKFDPDYKGVDEETLKKYPMRHWNYLNQSGSQEELSKREGRLTDIMGKEQELGKMGTVPALIGGLAGTLLDVDTLVSMLPIVGTGAGLLSKASRVANFVRMGAYGASTNVAWDLVTQSTRPTATMDDLYFSAAFGMALGGAGGAAISPTKLRLRAENKALQDFALRGAKKQVDDDFQDLLKSPLVADNFKGIDHVKEREAFLKELDTWSDGMGLNPPEKPVMAILRGSDEPIVKGKGEDPTLPKGGDIDEPTLPKGEPPVDPVVNPSGKPWDATWDTPVYNERMGAADILALPPQQKISELADYVRIHSKNRDMVALMDRMLKGIDLRKLKFAVIDPRHNPRKSGMDRETSNAITSGKAYGVVSTPGGSRGEGIQMALRGYGFGASTSGLNEETFIHELAHAATVYRLNLVKNGVPGVNPRSQQAFTELGKLYKDVKKASKGMDKGAFPLNFYNNMKNQYEFISYGLTNRRFQEWLKTVEIAGGRSTMWTQFTDGLRKLLGMTSKEGNAYAKLIDLSDAMFERTGVEGRPRALFDSTSPTVTHDDIHAAEAANLPPVFGWGLGMEHRLGSQKLAPAIRNLAGTLFGSTVGYKDHSVVKRNVWDDTTMIADGWIAANKKVSFVAFDGWTKDLGKTKKSERGPAWEEFGQEVSDYVRGFDREYHPEVKKAGDNLRDLMDKAVDEINNPALRDGGKKRGLTEVEGLDDAGELTVTGTLQKNPNYLPRKHDATKWNAFVTQWGREATEGFWARAYKASRPDITDEQAARWAGWYSRTVEEAHINRSTDHLEEMMSGFDQGALKESLVRNGGFSEHDAWTVINGMFQKRGNDAGRTSSSLRHRNSINETYTEKWKTKDGEDIEITINDFIHSNALDVADTYFRRTGSSIALANRLDVYKQSDIGRLIADATDQRFGAKGMNDATAEQARKDLKFAIDRIQGLPQEEWTPWHKGFEMWRAFNVIRLMGGSVWNQLTELSQVVGSMGWKATLGASLELRGLRRDIKSGKAPHDFLDHLENVIGGVGSEYVARMDFKPSDDWVRYKGDTAGNRRLDKLDNGLKRTARGVLEYTGMTGALIQQKRVHAVALVNHFVNAANGKPSKYLSKDRLAWMGMTEGDYAGLSAAIKKYSKPPAQGTYGKKIDFDFKKMSEDDPAMHSMLANAIHRETRRVIQENDLASMVPIMGSTIGKTVFQFMNFSINGWNKSLLFGMHHRDISTFSMMMHGAFFASLAYMGRTQLSSLGMDAEEHERFMDQRMSGKQIVANSFGRMAQASLLPALYDSTLGNVTGAAFSGMRSTSDISSMASNPTLQGINSVLSMGKMLRNGFSNEYQTTQRDMRAWGKLLPLNNVAPVSTLLNALSHDYPYEEKEAD